MAHDVRAFEEWPTELRREGERALSHLFDLATSPDRQRAVVYLLQAAVEEVEDRPVAGGQLPEAEQAVWESVGADFSDPDAAGRGRARSVAAFAALMDRSIRGDAAVASYLKVDRSRVSQRVSERSLYSFAGGGGERFFPEWQFDDHGPIRDLRTVLVALDPRTHPLVVDHWARTPNVDLVVDDEALSPVTWLRTGGSPDRLIELLPQP